VFKRHEVLRAFAAHHGQMLNYAAVGRTLATTRLKVGRYLRRLQEEGALRLLPALPEPCPPDMIRRPRLYLRAGAWAEAFAANPHASGCLRVPLQAQLASRIGDGIIERETAACRGSRFYCMGRYRRRGVDLVVERASGWRLGFCFEPRTMLRQWSQAVEALREAQAARWINAAILVTCEGEPNFERHGVLHLPGPLLLAMYGQWTSEGATTDLESREDLYRVLKWLNGEFLMILGLFWDPQQPPTLDFQYEGLPEEAEPWYLRPP